MAQFVPFEDGVEVNGQTVLAVVAGMPAAGLEDRALELLAEHGIEDPQPDEWYSQKAWLETFAAIHERVGEATLNQIGQSIPENADWPPGVDSLKGGLESIDQAYHMNHRNGEIGHYHAEQVDDETIRVECKNPYACAFDKGIIEATARAFSGDQFATVNEVSTHCRNDGGEACVYEVTWW